MTRPITNPDTTPPTAPTNFVRTGGSATTIATSWTASTDNVAVNEYWLYRNGVQAGTSPSTSFTFTGLTCGTSSNLEVEAHDAAGNTSPRAGLRRRRTAATSRRRVLRGLSRPPARSARRPSPGAPRPTTSASLATTSIAPRPPASPRRWRTGSRNRPARATSTPAAAAGTYFYGVTAEDAAGNVGRASNRGKCDGDGRHHARPRPRTLTATGGPGQVALTWSASTDNVGVARYDVHRSTTTGFTPVGREPDRAADRDELHRHGARGRHLLLPGDRRGRDRQPLPAVGAGERYGDDAAPPVGLVAAYGFDEGTGTGTADSSGQRQHAALSRRDVDDRQVRHRALLRRRQRLRHRRRTRRPST